ncbi:D-amino acid dehydrogenase [Nitrogeniibacter mangrovi]|uniref:D-amino acid dehydrogenase n=1 Tax=Nitrogeniibacter mangrovi TaxID=2016596 RepID=A0A6C1B749_9RHOO|nr:D-amino acid dehydrogenase [Nitrogeniibacter mangrovi]QID18558.1 D-amino acid dehydrogenase [Nitrogeniibacter mangrovi]
MHVLVLGAGLAGVTSAWYLKRAGFDVTVVDRQDAPAMETSFANGGQISVSHPEPWANPSAPMTVLRWLGKDDAPLKFSPHADWRQWAWAARFLRECLPWRTERNTRAIAALARYSRRCLAQLRDEAGLDYPHTERGILHLFFEADDVRAIPARVAVLAQHQIRAEACDAARCVEIEPALAHMAQPPLGGIYAPDDESGDAHAFIDALAARLQADGVRFRFGTRIEGIDHQGDLVEGVRVVAADGRPERIEANSYVVCLGSYSPMLVAPLGERLPIYPVKGYSISVPVVDAARVPEVSLTDEARRIVCSRFGDTLRVAGTAELNGYDLTLDPRRSRGLIEWVASRFPGGTDLDAAQTWCGLRPTTPGNTPLIGKSGLLNLYYNTGHGTLGWTQACGSAAALADLMSGTPPIPDFPFLGTRFDG